MKTEKALTVLEILLLPITIVIFMSLFTINRAAALVTTITAILLKFIDKDTHISHYIKL